MATPHDEEPVRSEDTTQPMDSEHPDIQTDKSKVINSEEVNPEPIALELPDSEQANPEPLASELPKSEQVESEPRVFELPDSEQENPQPIASELPNSEHVHSEARVSELPDSEQANQEPMATELPNSEQVDSEPRVLELPNSKQAISEPRMAELSNSEQINSELMESELTNSEQVMSEPLPNSEQQVNSEPMESELTNSEQVTSEPMVSELPNSEQVNKEQVSQLTNSEQANSEPTESEPTNSEQVTSEPMVSELTNSKQINSEPIVSELPNSDQVNSEVMVSELPSSQHIGEAGDSQAVGELVNSHTVSAEPVQPQPVNTEVVHSEPMTDEIAHPQPVNLDNLQSTNAEFDHSKLVSAEFDPSQSTNAELDRPQPVSELDNSQPANAEVDHSETKNAEADYSHPTNIEDDHSQHVNAEFDHTRPANADDSQPANVVVDHCQTMDAELDHTQPVHAEFDHSQTMNADVDHSHSRRADFDHSQTMNTGLDQPHPMNTEFGDTQSMAAEFDHSNAELGETQPLGPEFDPSQPMNSDIGDTQPLGPEFDHSQPMDAELNHSQPMSVEFSHSEPVSSDLVHSQPFGVVDLANLRPVTTESVNLQSLGVGLVNSQAIGTEIIVSQIGNSAMVNSETITPEAQPSKRRKKKSIVWEHFTIETVGAGCRRACCKVCKQSFAYSTGSKVAGTSHLKRHIAKGTCPVILRQQERNQLTPYMLKSGGTDTVTDPPKRRYRSSGSPYLIFDQDRCRNEIARMIIMHEYPLHMVEHPGFVAFVQNLQPRFDMVSFNIVQGDCVATYLREKQNLQQFFETVPGRVSLALDTWASCQTTSYVFLTAQVIDNEWKLHRRLLNVVMEPFPESDMAFSHAVATCLSDWGLDGKLASITFNQSLGEAGLEHLRAILSVKNSSILEGQLLIRNCLACTLSSMAQDILNAGQDTIKKIRASVKYVKTSESHEEKFLQLKQQLQVPSEKSLSIDNVTKWNTTYQMLLAAWELKEVFSCLDTSDTEYKDVPSMDEWKKVENICIYLKLLYDTAYLLTTKSNPPSNVFFHEVWKIQLELARAAASDDPFISDLAKPLQDRFRNYWKSSCLILAVAVAMDPRFKMKLVEFSFTKIFGEEAPVFIRVVDKGIHDLFDEYTALPLPACGQDGKPANNVKSEQQQQEGGGTLLSSNGLSDFDMYIMETSGHMMKSELDQYLEESLLPRVPDFDVLGWWKLNRFKYPTLSKMARDILTIPMSTVPPESVFDTVKREMDAYRCSLRPETVEALICAKDWLQQEPPGAAPTPLKMEL